MGAVFTAGAPSAKGKQEYFIKLNVDGLLRGDYASRMTGYATARQNGWMSANDIREMEDLNPIPDEEGGNLYLVNGSMTKLKTQEHFRQSREKMLHRNSNKRGHM